jgi:carbon monoxide dehydrogenase subunit G
MKYSVSVEINKPLDEVLAAFDNPDNMSKWMEGLQSYELLSGTQGAVGAKSRMKFKMGKREIEMIETITEVNPPSNYSMTYDAKGVFNIINNRFEKISETQTRYITDNEFQFKGFMKIMGALMPGAFKKQSQKYLNDFKRFIEE